MAVAAAAAAADHTTVAASAATAAGGAVGPEKAAWGPTLGPTQQSRCDCVRINAQRRSLALLILLDPDTCRHTPVKTPGTTVCSGTSASSALPPGLGWKAVHQAPAETH